MIQVQFDLLDITDVYSTHALGRIYTDSTPRQMFLSSLDFCEHEKPLHPPTLTEKIQLLQPN